jgi:hypothetical protein
MVPLGAFRVFVSFPFCHGSEESGCAARESYALAALHNSLIALTRREGFRISRADRANFLVLPRSAGAH